MKQLITLFLFITAIAWSKDTTTAINYGNWNIQLHTLDGEMVSVAAWTQAPTGETLGVRVMKGELDTFIVWTRTITKLHTTKIATALDDFRSLDTWEVEKGDVTFPPDPESFLKLLLNGSNLTVTVQAADKKKYRATFNVEGLSDAMDNSQELQDFFNGVPVGR